MATTGLSASRRSVIRAAAVAGAVLLLVVALGRCSRNDGRTMRPVPGAQTDTVAQPTTSSSTTQAVDGGQSEFRAITPWVRGEMDTGVPMPARYSCDEGNHSPPVAWTGGPAGIAAYAIVLTDLDAPEYTHWVVANIPKNQTSVDEDYADPLAVMATNSEGKPSYTGPCPPKGSAHDYVLTVYALGQILEAQSGDPAPALIAAIENAAIATAQVRFAYSR